MERLDVAMGAFKATMMERFHIILGPVPMADIRNFIPVEFSAVSDDQFCTLFWSACKIAVNRVLCQAGQVTLDEDGSEMNDVYLLWKSKFEQQ